LNPATAGFLFLWNLCTNVVKRKTGKKEAVNTQQFEIHAIKAIFSTINFTFVHSYPEKQSLSERLPSL
jgi:hypothetical protein